jgi:hypothetical protein
MRCRGDILSGFAVEDLPRCQGNQWWQASWQRLLTWKIASRSFCAITKKANNDMIGRYPESVSSFRYITVEPRSSDPVINSSKEMTFVKESTSPCAIQTKVLGSSLSRCSDGLGRSWTTLALSLGINWAARAQDTGSCHLLFDTVFSGANATV